MYDLLGNRCRGTVVATVTCGVLITRLPAYAQSTVTPPKLHVPFRLVEGEIYYVPEIASPSNSGAAYYLYKNGWEGSVAIRRLSDLEGRVKIRSAAQALAFVRLKTSPRTFEAIGGAQGTEAEVIAREALNLEITIGDARLLKPARKWANGYMGIVDRAVAKRLGIPLTRMSRRGSAYVITRTIVRKELRNGIYDVGLFRAQEEVRPNGAYREARRAPYHGTASEEIDWKMPAFDK